MSFPTSAQTGVVVSVRGQMGAKHMLRNHLLMNRFIQHTAEMRDLGMSPELLSVIQTGIVAIEGFRQFLNLI